MFYECFFIVYFLDRFSDVDRSIGILETFQTVQTREFGRSILFLLTNRAEILKILHSCSTVQMNFQATGGSSSIPMESDLSSGWLSEPELLQGVP